MLSTVALLLQYYDSVFSHEQLYVLRSKAAVRARDIIDAVWGVMKKRMDTLEGGAFLDF